MSNREELAYMVNTVIDYIIASYKNYESKIAIVYKDKPVTYKELYNVMMKTAGWINTYMHVRNKPILVMMKNSDKAIAAFLGIALSGNIYVPLDIDIPYERLKKIIQILQPECVINCEESKSLQIKDLPIVSWDEIQKSKIENGMERIGEKLTRIHCIYSLHQVQQECLKELLLTIGQ